MRPFRFQNIFHRYLGYDKYKSILQVSAGGAVFIDSKNNHQFHIEVFFLFYGDFFYNDFGIKSFLVANENSSKFFSFFFIHFRKNH